MKEKRNTGRQGTRSLQQTISAGKEIAAIGAGHPHKVDPKVLAQQLIKNPKVQRMAMVAGGVMAAASIGKTIAQYTFYKSVVAAEVKKSLKPVCKQLDELQTSVDELNRKCDRMQKQLAEQKKGGKKDSSSDG